MTEPSAEGPAWIADLRRSQALWERAPSAHNTQPWMLHVDGDEVVSTATPKSPVLARWKSPPSAGLITD